MIELVPTPDNPVPDGATVLRAAASDGVGVRAAFWPALVESPRGTVLVIQGRAEFIEKYFEVIAELRGRGFAVATFDWRGQGGSERRLRDARKGHVRRFSDYYRDVEAVMDQIVRPSLPEPHFVLAHSMGGAVALAMARAGRLAVERLVTTAPMIELAMVRRVQLARGLATVLSGLGFGRQYIPGGGATSIATKPFAGNPLTGDPRRYARNADAAAAFGSGAIGDPTIGWVNGAFGFMARFQEPRAPIEIRLPTLVIVAGQDRIVSTPAVERFAARLKAGHAILLEGALHEILMERDAIRTEFWAAFDAFVPGTPDPDWARRHASARPEGIGA